jgi:hypothetical protein
MRKWFILITLVFLLGFSNAVSYDLSLDKNTVGAYDIVQVRYSISFGESKSIAYSLTLYGDEYNQTLKQESAITYLIDNTYILPVSNIPAGDYNITLLFTTDEGSTSYRKSLTILPTPVLLVLERSFDIVCFQNVTTDSISVKNSGNVPLDVRSELKGVISLTISPTTFTLPRDGEQVVNISVVKPETDKIFNITFTGNYGNEQASERVDFRVIIPNITVLFNTEILQGNQTFMDVNLSNMGNVRQNVTFTVSYLTMEGVDSYVFYRQISEHTNASFSQELPIPSDSKILSASATFLNNAGESESITYNYGFFGIVLPPFLLDAFVTIWTNSTYRGVFIAGIAVLVIYLIYALYLKKKIFKKA